MPETKSRFDVFISYRRSNVEFVKKFLAALEATGRNAWIDWEDIPPGAENFSDEIINGIDGSNAFIPILSPDYLDSEYCLMELHRAVELKKRIIPIIYEKFELFPAIAAAHIQEKAIRCSAGRIFAEQFFGQFF